MAQPDIDETLKDRANLLWRLSGAPKGREHEFWAQAARELLVEMQMRAPASRPAAMRIAS